MPAFHSLANQVNKQRNDRVMDMAIAGRAAQADKKGWEKFCKEMTPKQKQKVTSGQEFANILKKRGLMNRS